MKNAVEFALAKTGLTALKSEQLSAISHIVGKKDALVVLPTGYGKSIIYQLMPVILDTLNNHIEPFHIVIVISPLISLMVDQVAAAKRMNISATYVEQNGGPRSEIANGKFQVVYVTPEALNSRWFNEVLRTPLYQERTALIAVDEAHCILKWGKNFRPDYLKLNRLRSIFPEIPLLALTATATLPSQKNIKELILMKKPALVTTNPNRGNIKLCIKQRIDNISMINHILVDLAAHKSLAEIRIIYCSSLNKMKWVYSEMLSDLETRCQTEEHYNECVSTIGIFHKEAPSSAKESILQSLQMGELGPKRCILATVSLGMGIDSPCIRQIIHIGCPTDLEDYAQEIGRASRDAQKGEAIMFVNGQDCSRRSVTMQMKSFIKNKDKCRRKLLLQHFSAKLSPSDELLGHACCDVCEKQCNCSQCQSCSHSDAEEYHPTQEVNGEKSADIQSYVISAEQRSALREDLLHEWNTLGSVTESLFVGEPKLVCWISPEHIEQFIKNCHLITNEETLRKNCNVFSKDHAYRLLMALSKYAPDIEVPPAPQGTQSDEPTSASPVMDNFEDFLSLLEDISCSSSREPSSPCSSLGVSELNLSDSDD